MSEKHIENSTNEKILETQEESEEDDELIFTFFFKDEIVSWAKTQLYSYLKEIHTAIGKKRKGYGRKLLFHIEKTAKEHGATTMKARYDECCSDEAAGFFRDMRYVLKPVESDSPGFLEATKKL